MQNDPSRTFALSEYWAGIEKGFREKAKSLKKSLNHSSTGIAVEGRFQRLLSEYLPRRYVLAPGFVADASGARSPMMDLIISDCLHIPPLSVEPSYTVFACESVAGAIEITTGPRGQLGKGPNAVSKLHADLRKLSVVRKLGENRHYHAQVPIVDGGAVALGTADIVAVSPGPRSFLVTCGDEWVNASTYERNLVAALKAVRSEGRSVWLHAAYSVKHGLLSFVPYTDFECTWTTKDPLLEFVMFINQSLTNFPTYQIDLRRYRSSMPPDGQMVGSPPVFVPDP
jgi:hypothetical protein